MEKNQNRIVNMVLKYIEENGVDVNEYVKNVLQRTFSTFKDESEINFTLKEYFDNYFKEHTLEDSSNLKAYTGRFDSNRINQILRGYWDYETNGRQTDEIKEYSQKYISTLSDIMKKSSNIGANITTYRGTDIEEFRKYGVTSLEDLPSLNGQYLYEEAFTSSSLIRERSLLGKEITPGKIRNIEVEYLIPDETNEVAPLVTENLSHVPSEYELLIDKYSLFKVVDVTLSSDKQSAYLKVVLISKKIYEIDNTKTENRNK